jgi:hypothetical protein
MEGFGNNLSACGNNMEAVNFVEHFLCSALFLVQTPIETSVAAVKEYTTDRATWEGFWWGTLIHRDEHVEEED